MSFVKITEEWCSNKAQGTQGPQYLATFKTFQVFSDILHWFNLNSILTRTPLFVYDNDWLASSFDWELWLQIGRVPLGKVKTITKPNRTWSSIFILSFISVYRSEKEIVFLNSSDCRTRLLISWINPITWFNTFRQTVILMLRESRCKTKHIDS